MKMLRRFCFQWALAPLSSSSTRLGTIGVAITWLWACARLAPADLPWFLNIST